jgi:hypothetical protein
MAKVFTYGLESVEFGDIATDGGLAATFSAKGLTFKDSFEINTADADMQEFMSEENDDPEVSISTQGKKGYKFQLMNPGVDELEYFLGGTVISGPPKKWNAPDNTPIIEKSVKITPKVGHILTITRARITAKQAGKYAKTGLAMLDIMITVMKPTKTGEPSMSQTEQ